MRVVSEAWGSLNSSKTRERRFFFRVITVPGDETGDVYIRSHEDISITTTGSILLARPKSHPKIRTQSLNPDEGRSTIGTMSFDAIDIDSTLTARLRLDLNTNDVGWRGKRCEYYSGFRQLAAADYELEDTQLIDRVTYARTIYQFRCRDVQREARKKIADPIIMRLAQPLDATSTTIEIATSNGLTAIEHGASYSDAPSATVAYVKIDDEIIRVPSAGIGASQLTSCVRGVLGTRAAAHTTDEGASSARGKEVTEVIYLELPVPKLVYALLTGVLIGQTPTLPAHWHLGIDAADFVRLSEFQNIGADLYDSSDDTLGMIERYILTESEDGKTFIEKEILRKYGLFMPIHVTGEIGLRRGQPVLSGSAVVGEINDSMLVSEVTVAYAMDKIINRIRIGWNEIDGEPSRNLDIVDASSITKWQDTARLDIVARGLVGSRQTDSRVRDIFEGLRDRYSGPPIVCDVEVHSSQGLYEVGDVVRLRTSTVRDFTSAGATTMDRAFEIQGVSKNLSEGTINYSLFGSSQAAGPLPPIETTAALPDAFYVSGTNIAGMSGVVDAGSELVLPNGITFTGAATVAGAVYYATKDVRLPSGLTAFYTQNVQLRIRGVLQIDGDFDGVGAGLAGVADTADTSSIPPFSTAVPTNFQTQAGVPGYFGITQAGGALIERVRQRSGSDSRYRVQLQSIPAVFTAGLVEAIPSLNLVWDGSGIQGVPADLRGTSGGPGGLRYWNDSDPDPDFIEINRGGDGGAGGAGLLIISRGVVFGASGRIDSSGGDGAVGVRNAGNERPAWSSGGAGGAPGATLMLLDGSSSPSPVLTSGTIIADYGATPGPGDPHNVMLDSYFEHQDTRFGPPSVNRAFVEADRSSFYTSATSGRQAGIAAARFFFLLPQVTPEEDTNDTALAAQQDITLGIAEAYSSRFDPAITLLIATITENVTTAAYSHSNIYTRLSTASVWTFRGPAEPSLQFELPADGNTYQIKAVPVLINGVEAPEGEEVGEVVSDGTGIAAVQWNNNIAGQVFESDDFGDGSLANWQARWSEFGTAGDSQSVQSVTGIIGGYAWRFGDNSGNDTAYRWIDRRRCRAVVEGKLYRIYGWVRRIAGSGTIYVGVQGFKGDVRSGGGSYVSNSGADNTSNPHSFGANAYDPADTNWHFVEGYFIKGQAYAFRAGTPEDPHVLHPDLEYVSPMFLINYTGVAGTTDIGYMGLEETNRIAAPPETGSNLILDPNFVQQYASRSTVLVPTSGAVSADFRYWGASANTWGLNTTAGEHGGLCATLAANLNGTLISSRFIPASNAERFFQSLRVNFGSGYNGTLSVDMYLYDASRSFLGTVVMNAISGPTTGTWLTANYSGVVNNANTRFVHFGVAATGGTAGTIAVQSLQASRQPFPVTGDDPSVTVDAVPRSLIFTTYEAGGWSTSPLDSVITFRRGSQVIATRTVRGTVDEVAPDEGDVTPSNVSNTGEATSYSATAVDTAGQITVTHTASGVSIIVPWVSDLPGYTGGPTK